MQTMKLCFQFTRRVFLSFSYICVRVQGYVCTAKIFTPEQTRPASRLNHTRISNTSGHRHQHWRPRSIEDVYSRRRSIFVHIAMTCIPWSGHDVLLIGHNHASHIHLVVYIYRASLTLYRCLLSLGLLFAPHGVFPLVSSFHRIAVSLLLPFVFFFSSTFAVIL
jgi:hypothetical protein